jgi:hypothetical protein
MTNREYKLFNWKIDGDSGKREIYNWNGEQLNDDELNKLRIGDCVRLILMDTQQDSTNIPRTFYGKALDTYRLEPEEKLRYVHTGDIITFQKNNIIEIPYWSGNNPLKQNNVELINNFM